ncbi:MAG: alanine--tRNA ligase-related protein [Clostridia bacterium]|nr:alanine--tRNA ligase-related protein [Clostridia bacterium]
MTTIKLYDEDAYIKEFCATVVSCEKQGEKYKTVLDKTAFFPEAGGQPCDTGMIDGNRISDVQIENDIIYHFSDKPFSAGQTVNGKIDFERRFSFMQNHSGEHIVSGVINKLFSLDNVGFHLNEEIATLDFNGILDREQLDLIENTANKKVWENNAVKTYYPSAEELSGLEFRQKKEITGDIRIVKIENTDICACCAPHVKSTGEIGLIKLLAFEKMRGGTRIYMKCGGLALADYQNKLKNISKIQNLLSSKPEDTAEAVENLNRKLGAEKQKLSALNKKLIVFLAESGEAKNKITVVSDFDMKDLQTLADMLYKKFSELKVVLSEKEKDTYSFVIVGSEEETSYLFSKMKEELEVGGGGRNGMIQGTVKASLGEIKGVIESI